MDIFYGVTSERKLVEELRTHLAWRWFTGLGFDQEIPHHSTFSKNRHGRFQKSNIFKELFEGIVQQCVAVGLVQGDHLSVDGSFIQAAHVKQNIREYLDELERENSDEARSHQQDKVSTTDRDATFFTKGEHAPKLGHFDNYLIDNSSCIIVGVEATAARPSQEVASAQRMLAS